MDAKTVISIHAPVKGATIWTLLDMPATGEISIHAPVKGATRIVVPPCSRPSYFNPRTREGCDFAFPWPL